MEDNIEVALRVRPILEKELKEKLSVQWIIEDKSVIHLDTQGRQGHSYTFDHIFDWHKNNVDIFHAVVHPLVQSAMAGYNASVLAYGQTSSGKTYSMFGTENSKGLIDLSVDDIFESINNNLGRKFLLRLSFIEIYNEVIYDLLDEKPKDIKIRINTSGAISLNVIEKIIHSCEQAYRVVQEGTKRRRKHATEANQFSSRSHAIIRIIIESTPLNDFDSDLPVQVSYLNLVDLAGAERVSFTKAKGSRLQEGGYINKSLFALSSVIRLLSQGKNLPNCRDSKLTRILKESLGGNAKTLIIGAINPTAIEESNSTLVFISQAKTIKNKPVVNEIISSEALTKQYMTKIKELEKEIIEMKQKHDELQYVKHHFVTSKRELHKKSRRHTISVNTIVKHPIIQYHPRSNGESERENVLVEEKSFSHYSVLKENIDTDINKFDYSSILMHDVTDNVFDPFPEASRNNHLRTISETLYDIKSNDASDEESENDQNTSFSRLINHRINSERRQLPVIDNFHSAGQDTEMIELMRNKNHLLKLQLSQTTKMLEDKENEFLCVSEEFDSVAKENTQWKKRLEEMAVDNQLFKNKYASILAENDNLKRKIQENEVLSVQLIEESNVDDHLDIHENGNSITNRSNVHGIINSLNDLKAVLCTDRTIKREYLNTSTIQIQTDIELENITLINQQEIREKNNDVLAIETTKFKKQIQEQKLEIAGLINENAKLHESLMQECSSNLNCKLEIEIKELQEIAVETDSYESKKLVANQKITALPIQNDTVSEELENKKDKCSSKQEIELSVTDNEVVKDKHQGQYFETVGRMKENFQKELKPKHENTSDLHNSLNCKLEKEIQELKTANQRLELVQSQNIALLKELKKKEEANINFENQIEVLNKDNKALQDKLRNQKLEMTGIIKENANLQRELGVTLNNESVSDFNSSLVCKLEEEIKELQINNKKLEPLQCQNATLLKELKEKKEVNNCLEKQIEVFLNDKKVIQDKLKDEKLEIAGLIEENANLQNELQIALNHENISSLNSSLVCKLEEEIKELQINNKKLEPLQCQNATLLKELKEKKEVNNCLEKQIELFLNDKKVIQDKLKDEKLEIAGLIEENANLQNELQIALNHENISSLNSSLVCKLEEEIKKLQTTNQQLQPLQIQNATLLKELNEKEDALITFKNQTELAIKDQKIMQDKHQKDTLEIARLIDENGTLQNELEIALNSENFSYLQNSMICKLEEEIDKLQVANQQLESLQNQNATLLKELTEKEDALTILKRQIELSIKDKKVMQDKLQEEKLEITRLIEENAQFQKELNVALKEENALHSICKLENKIKELQIEVCSLIEEKTVTINSYENQKLIYDQKIEALQTQNATVLNELKKKEDYQITLESQIKLSVEENKALMNKLEEKCVAYFKLTEELNELTKFRQLYSELRNKYDIAIKENKDSTKLFGVNYVLKTDFEAKEKLCNELLQTNTRLNQEKESISHNNTKLDKINSELKEENRVLSDKVIKQKNEMSELMRGKQSSVIAENNLKLITTKLDIEKERHYKATAEINTQRILLAQKHNEILKLNAEKKLLEQEFSKRLNQEKESISHNNTKLDKINSELKEENRVLSDTVIKQKNEMSELMRGKQSSVIVENNLKLITTKLDIEKERHYKATAEINTQRILLAQKHNEILKLNAEKKLLEQEFSNVHNLNEKLLHEKRVLQENTTQQINIPSSRLSSQDQYVCDTCKNLRASSSKTTRLLHKVKQMNETIMNLDREIIDTVSHVRDLERQMETQSKEIAKLKTANGKSATELKKRRSSTHDSSRDIDKENEEPNSCLSCKATDSIQLNGALTRELKRKVKEQAKLQSEVQQLDLKVKCIDNVNRDLTEENQSVTNKCNKLMNTIKKLSGNECEKYLIETVDRQTQTQTVCY